MKTNIAVLFAASISVTMPARAETLPEAAKRVAAAYEKGIQGVRCDDATLAPSGKVSTVICRHEKSTLLSVAVVGTRTAGDSQRKSLEVHCETITREDKLAAISSWPIEAERFAGFCNFKPR